jgi:hypothetical protein
MEKVWFRNYIGFTQLFLLVAALMFVWHNELIMSQLDFATAELSNGWYIFTGDQVYHLGMYFLAAAILQAVAVLEVLKIYVTRAMCS